MNAKERETLRTLAGRVADHTHSPAMEEKRRRMTAHNDLEEGRPIVLCFPEGCWPELLGETDLTCEDETARQYELELRRKLYWIETIADDAAHEGCWYVRPAVDLGSYGVEVPYTYGEDRGSYRWTPPIADLDSDFEKLKLPQPTHDRAETARRMGEAHDLFDGILEVRLRPELDYWTLGMTTDIIRLIGLEGLFLAMVDNPEGLHRLMAFLRQSKEEMLDWYAAQGDLIVPNDRDGYTGSGGQAYTNDLPAVPGQPFRQLWGFAESQETVGVSPRMFGEFVFPYQLPLLERFGLNCYGCCEPVHERMAYIEQIPRLRRVSVSPWCNQPAMAEALGRRVVFSRKPNPAHICAGFQEDAARADIVSTLEVTRGCNVELIMKDTHTVQNEPWRIACWVQIAREEIDRRY